MFHAPTLQQMPQQRPSSTSAARNVASWLGPVRVRRQLPGDPESRIMTRTDQGDLPTGPVAAAGTAAIMMPYVATYSAPHATILA